MTTRLAIESELWVLDHERIPVGVRLEYAVLRSGQVRGWWSLLAERIGRWLIARSGAEIVDTPASLPPPEHAPCRCHPVQAEAVWGDLPRPQDHRPW